MNDPVVSEQATKAKAPGESTSMYNMVPLERIAAPVQWVRNGHEVCRSSNLSQRGRPIHSSLVSTVQRHVVAGRLVTGSESQSSSAR
jgi:hypothetical protein